MTPSRSGRIATMLAGVRPTIRFASAPMASTRFERVSMATTDGSLITMPRLRTVTSVFAVPRSMPTSWLRRPSRPSKSPKVPLVMLVVACVARQGGGSFEPDAVRPGTPTRRYPTTLPAADHRDDRAPPDSLTSDAHFHSITHHEPDDHRPRPRGPSRPQAARTTGPALNGQDRLRAPCACSSNRATGPTPHHLEQPVHGSTGRHRRQGCAVRRARRAMSVALDANVLLHASDDESAYRERAIEIIDEIARGPQIVYLFWPTVMAYLRIATHPSIFSRPLPLAKARDNVEQLLGLPNV